MSNFGSKHTCQNCHKKFYDMGASVVACPVCASEVKRNRPLYSAINFPVPSDESGLKNSANDNYVLEDFGEESAFGD